MIWWLAFEKKPFQFWREIWIQIVVILLQLYLHQERNWNAPMYIVHSMQILPTDCNFSIHIKYIIHSKLEDEVTDILSKMYAFSVRIFAYSIDIWVSVMLIRNHRACSWTSRTQFFQGLETIFRFRFRCYIPYSREF